MAPKAERIKVEVTDSTEGETRTFKIILSAPNTDFQLADLLRQRGVISPVNAELKEAVKVATQNYLSGAEALISTLAKGSSAIGKPDNKANQRNLNAANDSSSSATASELQQGSIAGSN
jgi:hypothetical protein